MPPKAAAGAGNDGFLAACFKCARGKLDVDFDLLAKTTGMSKGGASNKYRAIMKAFEDESAIISSNGNAITEAKVAEKRKAAPKDPVAEDSDGEGEDNDGDKPTPKKIKTKAKAAPKKKKGTATAKNKKAIEVSTSEDDAGGEEQAAVASEEEA